jgi:hypothetical protein
MKKLLQITLGLFLFFFVVNVLHPASVYAHHSWNNYHWARTSNPFKVTIGDNVSSQWDSYMLGAAYYWNRSSVLDVPVVYGGTSPSKCQARTGRVQVCNYSYGDTGWMGLAQLWTNGDHITAATVKLNDTYFNQSRYNNNAWKNLVMCQEIGHTFGLTHQDEDFSNTPLGTCMDYSSNAVPNQWPNAHDYSQLESIYAHLDARIASDETTLAGSETPLRDTDLNNPNEWGTQVGGKTTLAVSSDHIASYERDLGAGKKLRTIVIHSSN